MTETFNVKYISNYIDNHIALIANQYFWIEGEIQNYRNSNKHQYFSLCEENISIKAIIWESVYKRLNIDIKNGLYGKFYCKINYYSTKNDISLIITKIETDENQGKIYDLYDQNRLICEQKGYFDKTKIIPSTFKNIAIITRYESAAYNDFISVIRECCKMNVYIYDSGMQGESSISEIKFALNTVNKLRKKLNLDCIIITRGGGSIEDLWIFNDINILDEIYLCKVPIFTGIGHNIDHSLSDLICDKSFITPTDIARFILSKYSKVDRIKNLEYNREFIKNKLELLINDKLKFLKNVIDNIKPSTDVLDKQEILYIDYKNLVKNKFIELLDKFLCELDIIKLTTKNKISSDLTIELYDSNIKILEETSIIKGKYYSLKFNNKLFKIKII